MGKKKNNKWNDPFYAISRIEKTCGKNNIDKLISVKSKYSRMKPFEKKNPL